MKKGKFAKLAKETTEQIRVTAYVKNYLARASARSNLSMVMILDHIIREWEARHPTIKELQDAGT